MECYYHNVAEVYNEGNNYIFGAINIGYKKAWFECRGSVTIGIDATKVAISEPDSDGVVTITIPKAQVLGTPKVDESSISEVCSDTGLLTSVTNEDSHAALAKAQESMKAQAESDEELMLQANKRARTLLEQYVVNIGRTIGKDYAVKFEEAQ